jgi:dienelactone hydrolase
MSRAQKLGQPDWTGMPSSFCISPHGEFAIYLQSESSNSCFDHDSIFIVQLNQPQTAHKVELLSADRQWQPRLLSVQWSFIDNKVVYAIIDDRANASVWKISLKESGSGWQGAACRLICAGRTTSVSPFVTAQGHENLLLHRSTFDATGVVEIMTLPADSEPEVRLISELRFEASHASHEQVFFPGSGDYEVQAFVHKPDTFREGSKYPIVVPVHGGPNDAWRDCWSTVWNPLLWTDQGYVVVTPNISGSTGFGLAYARSIYQNWGGRPYSDIDSLFSFIEKSMPYVDLTRVVGAGFSFGGYMMNWIAGHGTSDRFCALIVHGGVYSVRNLLSSDIPTVYPADFGGLPWEVPEVWDRWDPSRYSDAWKTPMLFTHGDLDYRVPITEAFAAFQACQLRRIPSRFLVFPNEGHAIRKPANLAQWHEEMVEWSLNWTRVDTDKCANLCIGDLRENADP